MGWRDWTCAVIGHAVDNRRCAAVGGPRRCVCCRRTSLPLDGRTIRVRHTLTCFLGRHDYRWTDERHGHDEYVCVRCGHPLLFASGANPCGAAAAFRKKVRYLCGVTGHAVHVVCSRHGFTEYACGCGHTFLLARPGLRRVCYPARCVAGVHRVRLVERRAGHDEFRCHDCGHPFAFVPPLPVMESRPPPALAGGAAAPAQASSRA
jgi:hypothetical protein